MNDARKTIGGFPYVIKPRDPNDKSPRMTDAVFMLPGAVHMGEYGEKLANKFPKCAGGITRPCPNPATEVIFGNVFVCLDHADMISHQLEEC